MLLFDSLAILLIYMTFFESEKLTSWFEKNRRDLPWRKSITPYAVWVSEIMLQQTQVSYVIPYFERWMARFPTVETLAAAPIDEVIKLWEGLGYYSRARNLHQGAKQIVEHFGGRLPDDPDQLATIKGLGPYTIGALCSFAFHLKVPAVDGNVMRVLTRYYNVAEDVTKTTTQKTLRLIAEQIMPEEKYWLFNEGLIELGATICQKKPACSRCPLANSCQSFRKGNQAERPYKSKRVKTVPIFRAVALITCDNHFLIKRVGKGNVMADLHEFPYLDLTDTDPSHMRARLEQTYPLNLSFIRWLPQESHSFTKYRATLFPAMFATGRLQDVPEFEWVSSQEIRKLPFSSGHRRLLNNLNDKIALPQLS